MKRIWPELLFLLIVWVGYGFWVYSDPEVLIGFMFPLMISGLALDSIEERI
jgi:hypothetical protein